MLVVFGDIIGMMFGNMIRIRTASNLYKLIGRVAFLFICFLSAF